MYLFKLLTITALSSGVVLLPVFGVLRAVRGWNWKRTGVYFLFCLYLCGIAAVVGLPSLAYWQYLRFEPNVNWIPSLFRREERVFSVLNVLLFLPLGVFLPALWQKYRDWRCTAIFGFALSLGIELLQTFCGRATDVNDLITNTAGCMLGFAAIRLLLQKKSAQQKDEAPLLLAVAAAVMFFIVPYLTSYLELAWM